LASSSRLSSATWRSARRSSTMARPKTLDDLVNFYNALFALGLTDQEHDDLVAFVRAL